MKKTISLILAAMILFSSAGALAYTPESLSNVIDSGSDRGITPSAPGADGNYPLNPVIPGESGTTGLPCDEPYIPILVNIDNLIGHHLQWGISKADIIYEMPISAYTNTRLVALFTHDYPTEAGPVRSARVHQADLRQEWDAAWCFYGAQTTEGSNVNSLLSKYGLGRRDGTIIYNGADEKKWTKAYTRVNYIVAPHNVSVDLSFIAALAAESGHVFVQRPFLFTDEKPDAGDDATKVNVIFNYFDKEGNVNTAPHIADNNNSTGSENCDAYYTYDAETNKYMRWNPNKGNYADLSDPDTQLGYENLIFQWTTLSWFDGNTQRPNLPDIVGSGNADFFMGGKHISGYWVRTGINERTVFFDADGNEIKLQRGKTWITIHNYRTGVSFE